MTTASTIQKKTLRLGSQGSEVKELQNLLNRYNFHLPENGVFGAWTENVVKDFQLTMFLDNDGIVGNRTWRTLYAGTPVDMPILRQGSRQSEVKIVQHILSQLSKRPNQFLYYYTGDIDAHYGVETERAVAAFQRNSGLSGDGVVGDRTWHGLSKHGYLMYYYANNLVAA